MSREQPDVSKEAALLRVLRVTSAQSAKIMTYTAAMLGMAALIPGLQLPPELGVIAAGIGVEAIGSLLDRIANRSIRIMHRLQHMGANIIEIVVTDKRIGKMFGGQAGSYIAGHFSSYPIGKGSNQIVTTLTISINAWLNDKLLLPGIITHNMKTVLLSFASTHDACHSNTVAQVMLWF